MFCSQCGKRLMPDSNFCSSCGHKVKEPPQQINTGEIARNVKKGLSKLPLITLIGDAVQGASGLSSLQEKIKNDSANPLYWLFYYECFNTHTKIRKRVSAARLIYNPVGFIISKGVATGLNALDDEYQSFDSTNCLKRAISLSRERIKEKCAASHDFLIVGKSLFYLAHTEELEKRNNLLLNSIQYISYAIEIETNSKMIGEYFYYLALVYESAGNREMYLRSLRLSVIYKFLPSQTLLSNELSKGGPSIKGPIPPLYINESEAVKNFTFTYILEMGERVENTLSYVFESQGNKIKHVANKLKSLF